MIIFIGNKSKPSYMIDITKNKLTVYQPDKYSLKEEEFFEKYSLGIVVFEINYKKIIFLKDEPIKYDKGGYNSKIVSELLIQTNKEFILLNKKISKLMTL